MTAAATVTMTDPRQSDSRTPERGLYLSQASLEGEEGRTIDRAGVVPSLTRGCRVL